MSLSAFKRDHLSNEDPPQWPLVHAAAGRHAGEEARETPLAMRATR
jgi:hypothetical protein